MSIKEILTEPNKILRQVSKSVDKVTNEDQALMDDMLDTMYNANGIGLAAIQIGIPKRIIVMDIAKKDEKKNPMYFVNPVIKNKNKDLSTYEEGCLSVPWVTAEVERASACSVSYLTTDFEPREINLPWPLSGAVQHEYDHLEGKLYLNRISRLKSARLKNFITKKRKKIEDYREDLLKDSEEKKIGRNKRREREKLSRKETKKRKAVKKLNSRSRRA